MCYNRISLLLVISIIFYLGCTSSSYLGSSYSPAFNSSQIDEIAIFYSFVNTSDAQFFDVEEVTVEMAKVVNKRLYTSLTKIVGSEAEIQSIDRGRYDEGFYDEINNEVQNIRQHLKDSNEAGVSFQGYSSEFDYAGQIPDLNSKYALFVYISPQMTQQSVNQGGYLTLRNIKAFSYLVEIESNEVIWVFDHSELIRTKGLDTDDIARTITLALYYNRDINFGSYEFEPNQEIAITEFEKSLYIANFVSLEGLTLTIKYFDSIRNKHLSEISIISKKGYGSSSSENTIYPKTF